MVRNVYNTKLHHGEQLLYLHKETVIRKLSGKEMTTEGIGHDLLMPLRWEHLYTNFEIVCIFFVLFLKCFAMSDSSKFWEENI